jgi:hypothetical protein
MIYLFLKIFAAVVLTEAITELVVKSELFEPLRSKIFDLSNKSKFFDWVHRLLDCGYCFSVWAGWLIAFLLFFGNKIFLHGYLDWVIVGLVLHRLSNMFHFLLDRLHGLDR